MTNEEEIINGDTFEEFYIRVNELQRKTNKDIKRRGNAYV